MIAPSVITIEHAHITWAVAPSEVPYHGLATGAEMNRTSP